MRFATFVSVLAVVFTGALTLDTASAAPAGIADMPLDIELQQADIHNIYALLSDVGGRKFVLDPCVKGSVDLRLQNMPVPLVLDALASKLQLAYEDDGDAVRVVCKDPDASAGLTAQRVSVNDTDAALPDVLARLAKSAGLAGVDYRAKATPKIDVKLPSVRLSTALTVLEETGGVKIKVVKNRLVVTD